MMRQIVLVGAPMQCGAGRPGCIMGPDALRTAGIVESLSALGSTVVDAGDLRPPVTKAPAHANPAIRNLDEVSSWIAALAEAAFAGSANGALPVFLGGDHAMSAGTVSGMAQRAAASGRRLFVLWLDAHSDFHTLASTQSGNLHGTPVAYLAGLPGFDGHFPPRAHIVAASDIFMVGLRSVDPAERAKLLEAGVRVADMRRIDEIGVAALLKPFLAEVAAVNGMLHVSLDVDFLDPAIAPAVGTTVPGGATFREAHLIMEMLHESGLVASLDIAELNPFLDERGRTATLMVDLAASLMGKTVMDRPTRSF